MSIDEALTIIEDSKKFLEPYKVYGQMISDGISQLEKLEVLIRDKAYLDAFKLSNTMSEQISGYRSFVPRLADNIDKIKEILRTSTG
jgi:hypothetical protein